MRKVDTTPAPKRCMNKRHCRTTPAFVSSTSTRLLARRKVPGFFRQYWWCLGRAVLQRSRDPLGLAVDTVVIAVTGMTLGLLSDRGRATIMHYAVSTTYSVVAIGLMASVGGLPTFSRHRLVAQREAAAGRNRLSFFLALDTVDVAAALVHSAVYLIMWYSFAVPRAVVLQMYVVTVVTVYTCTGMSYLLSQVTDSGFCIIMSSLSFHVPPISPVSGAGARNSPAGGRRVCLAFHHDCAPGRSIAPRPKAPVVLFCSLGTGRHGCLRVQQTDRGLAPGTLC